MTDKNEIQKAIDGIGEIGVIKYLPKGMKLSPCDIHGSYLTHYKNTNPLCPLCIKTGTGEGTTASQMEHWIDLKDQVQAATGYRPLG